VELPPAAGGSCAVPHCDPALGLSTLPATVLANYCQAPDASAPSPDAGTPAAQHSVCQLKELTSANNPADFQNGTCTDSSDPGWCYVTGSAAGLCQQALVFPQAAPINGALVHIACSEL
jgi:hypothetical protein